MRKGDLVKRVRFGVEGTPGRRAQQVLEDSMRRWEEPAVVVKGPYEAMKVVSDGHEHIYHAIDILYRGQLYKKLHADDFDRV